MPTPVFKTGLQSKSDVWEFILSTDDTDRMGDIVEQDWILRDFLANPIALWAHDNEKPVGIWENLRVVNRKLRGRLRLAAAGTSALIDTLRSLVEQRILRAVSVGFVPGKAEPLDPKDPWSGYRLSQNTLLECSLVSVPANPMALSVAKGLSAPLRETLFDPGMLREQAYAHSHRSQSSGPAPSATSGEANQTAIQRARTAIASGERKKEIPMSSLAERIVALKQEIVSLKDKLSDVTSNLESVTDEDERADVLREHETLTKRIESQQKTVDALEKTEAINATSYQSQRPQATSQAPAVIHNLKTAGNYKPGDFCVQLGVVRALAHLTRRSEAEVLEERYKHDQALRSVFDYRKRTAVAPGDTTTTGWAAELVKNDTRGFLEMLAPQSFAARLALRTTRLNFNGAHTVTVPRMSSPAATLTEPAWVGEGGAIPVTSFGFGSAVLSRYKLGALVPITMELVEQATVEIEAVLRAGLIEYYSKVLDAALISNGAAVTGVRPAGLLNGVAVGTGDATGGVDSVVADIRTLRAALQATYQARGAVLLLNTNNVTDLSLSLNALGDFVFRDEVASGRILTLEFIETDNVTEDTAIIIQPRSLITAFDMPSFDVSQIATYVEANADTTAPTHASTIDGTAATAGEVGVDAGIPVSGSAGAAHVGYTVRSAFQTYTEVLRMIAPTSWALGRTGAVAALSGLSWSGTSASGS